MSWLFWFFLFCLLIILIMETPIDSCHGLPGFTLRNNMINGPLKCYYESNPLPLDIVLETYALWKGFVDKYGIRWWFSEGTALGLYRGNEFNLNDDDIDVCIDGEWLPWFARHGYHELKSLGFRHVHTNPYFMMSFIRKRVKLDVAFQVRGPGLLCIADYGECDGTYPWTRNLKWVQGKYPVPDHVEYYETLYGPDWKIPKRSAKPNQKSSDTTNS